MRDAAAGFAGPDGVARVPYYDVGESVETAAHRPASQAPMLRTALLTTLVAVPVFADTAFTVDPAAGRNQFTAVFDATVGERIVAVSSEVGCAITVDERARVGSARCSVPLKSVRVDAHETKTEHFRQWATNAQGDPAACRLDVALGPVTVPSPAAAGAPVTVETPVTFTVCGRRRDDGGAERARITVAEAAPARAGAPRLLRIRAHVDGFDRERYRVGPRFTPGWLARVEELAGVVAPIGTIDVSLFATAPAE